MFKQSLLTGQFVTWYDIIEAITEITSYYLCIYPWSILLLHFKNHSKKHDTS